MLGVTHTTSARYATAPTACTHYCHRFSAPHCRDGEATHQCHWNKPEGSLPLRPPLPSVLPPGKVILKVVAVPASTLKVSRRHKPLPLEHTSSAGSSGKGPSKVMEGMLLPGVLVMVMAWRSAICGHRDNDRRRVRAMLCWAAA